MYIKMNPPLSAPGITYDIRDETKRVIQIVNDGFANCNLKSVLVNGNAAQQVELGVSRTNHMVLGAGVEEDPNITFHDIQEFQVQPKGLADKHVIKHYGLRVFGKENPEYIKIKYTYLGIPYTLEVDVKREK